MHQLAMKQHQQQAVLLQMAQQKATSLNRMPYSNHSNLHDRNLYMSK